MASTPESKVKKKVKQILEHHNAYYVMPVTSGYGNSGAPDFLVCYRGRFMGIECKAGKGKPTALQEDNIRRIIDTGGIAIVINESNIDSLEQEFRKYD
jgi:Holliday junction resolvase